MSRHVLLTMRDHALRRILAGALRTSGHAVVEAFDEPDMNSELTHTERPFDVIVRDARRYPDATLNDVVRLRNAGCSIPAVLLVGRFSDGFASEANRLGALLLPLPLKAVDLRYAIGASGGNRAKRACRRENDAPISALEEKPAALSGPPVSFEGEELRPQVSMSPYSPARVR